MMQADFDGIWSRACSYHVAHLDRKSQMQIENVTSQQTLLAHIHRLESKYNERRVSISLRRTQTFVAQLNSFSSIIQTLVQGNTKIAALVWGPLALILEVFYELC